MIAAAKPQYAINGQKMMSPAATVLVKRQGLRKTDQTLSAFILSGYRKIMRSLLRGFARMGSLLLARRAILLKKGRFDFKIPCSIRNFGRNPFIGKS